VSDAFEFYLKGIGHPSTTLAFFDKATRLIAGPLLCRAMFRFQCQFCLLFSKNFYPYSFCFDERSSVEMAGFEPATFALQRRCSPAELHPQATSLWA
jgi:hypothetical protein